MNLEQARQNLLNNVADVFIELRQEAGLSQKKAAIMAESTQARISELENGKRDILLSNLQRWAWVYGYNIEIQIVPIQDEETAAFYEALAEFQEEGTNGDSDVP